MKTGRPLIDIRGQTFGRLRVMRKAHSDANGKPFWECVCACGKHKYAYGSDLRSARVQSCGCLQKEGNSNRSHGMTRTSTYEIWKSMRQRCENPNVKPYCNYGGRGIKVCKRWQKFENFYADMGVRPAGLSLERRDNNKGYAPSNCYWATRKEQANNTRRRRTLKAHGREQTVYAWAAELGCAASTLYRRIHKGLPTADVLAPPANRGRRALRAEET